MLTVPNRDYSAPPLPTLNPKMPITGDDCQQLPGTFRHVPEVASAARQGVRSFQGSGFRVQGSGFRVQGSGFRV